LHADVETLDSLLDADFMCVGPLGFVLNKEQYLAPRRSGDLKQAELTWQVQRVRVYGEAAIAIGSQVQKRPTRAMMPPANFALRMYSCANSTAGC
jgi:hypothetical protein